MKSLPKSIIYANNLQIFDIDDNNFIEIPPFIEKIPCLREFVIGNNPLYSIESLKQFFPKLDIKISIDPVALNGFPKFLIKKWENIQDCSNSLRTYPKSKRNLKNNFDENMDKAQIQLIYFRDET